MIHLLAAAALAMEFAQPPSMRPLYEAVLHAPNALERAQALQKVSQTPPSSLDDLRRLFDLFMRFPDNNVRGAVMSSIERLTPSSARSLEQGFAEFLKLPEPEARVFGLRGLARLRSSVGSSYVRDLAKGKFKKPTPEELELPSQRDAWWVRYEALATLAIVEPQKAKPLVAAAAEQAPKAARLYASHYWPDALDKLTKWNSDRRAEALRADVPVADLRKTRGQMLAVVRDLKAPRDLRHQLAVKVGLTSEPAEVAELLKEHEATRDEETKLFFAAALFASRDPQTIPLLKDFALKHPSPQTRMGSLIQLHDMLPPAESKPLLEEARKTDPDPENKEEIGLLLKRP